MTITSTSVPRGVPMIFNSRRGLSIAQRVFVAAAMWSSLAAVAPGQVINLQPGTRQENIVMQERIVNQDTSAGALSSNSVESKVEGSPSHGCAQACICSAART